MLLEFSNHCLCLVTVANFAVVAADYRVVLACTVVTKASASADRQKNKLWIQDTAVEKQTIVLIVCFKHLQNKDLVPTFLI